MIQKQAAKTQTVKKQFILRVFAAFIILSALICTSSCTEKKKEVKLGHFKLSVHKTVFIRPVLPKCTCEKPCKINAELSDRRYNNSIDAFSRYLTACLASGDTFLLTHLAQINYGGGERYAIIRSLPEWDLSKPCGIELSIYIGSNGSSAFSYESSRRQSWFRTAERKSKQNLSVYQKLYFADTNALSFQKIRDSLNCKALTKVLLVQILADRKKWVE